MIFYTFSMKKAWQKAAKVKHNLPFTAGALIIEYSNPLAQPEHKIFRHYWRKFKWTLNESTTIIEQKKKKELDKERWENIPRERSLLLHFARRTTKYRTSKPIHLSHLASSSKDAGCNITNSHTKNEGEVCSYITWLSKAFDRTDCAQI